MHLFLLIQMITLVVITLTYDDSSPRVLKSQHDSFQQQFFMSVDFAFFQLFFTICHICVCFYTSFYCTISTIMFYHFQLFHSAIKVQYYLKHTMTLGEVGRHMYFFPSFGIYIYISISNVNILGCLFCCSKLNRALPFGLAQQPAKKLLRNIAC